MIKLSCIHDCSSRNFLTSAALAIFEQDDLTSEVDHMFSWESLVVSSVKEEVMCLSFFTGSILSKIFIKQLIVMNVSAVYVQFHLCEKATYHINHKYFDKTMYRQVLLSIYNFMCMRRQHTILIINISIKHSLKIQCSSKMWCGVKKPVNFSVAF